MSYLKAYIKAIFCQHWHVVLKRVTYFLFIATGWQQCAVIGSVVTRLLVLLSAALQEESALLFRLSNSFTIQSRLGLLWCFAWFTHTSHFIHSLHCSIFKGKTFLYQHLFFSPFPVHQYLLRAVFFFVFFIVFTIRCNSEITHLMQWLPCSTTVPHKADRNLNSWINADHRSTKTKPEKGRTFLFSDGTKSLLIGWKWQEGALLNTGPLKCPCLMYSGEVSHPDVFLQV